MIISLKTSTLFKEMLSPTSEQAKAFDQFLETPHVAYP